MNANVYFETLRLGFENPTGISFNEIVKRLNIDLSDISFKTNYTVWFYSNFYNQVSEKLDTERSHTVHPNYPLTERNINKVESYNDEKSYIKGDAINKYIDFVELQNARKSSITATRISLISILIAISSIVIPFLYPKNPKPPYEVIITNDRNNATDSKLNHSLDCKSGVKEKDNMNNNQTNIYNTLDKTNPK